MGILNAVLIGLKVKPDSKTAAQELNRVPLTKTKNKHPGFLGTFLLTFYPVLLHFLDLCDGLPQIICKFLPILGVGCIEVYEDFDVCTWDS